MSRISVDIANLRGFAQLIANLVNDLQPSAFVPSHLLTDPSQQHPDVAQHIGPAIFTDGLNLYNSYKRARERIVGDESAASGVPAPGSLTDFLGQLKILASVAGQIADSYEKADNETAFGVAQVDAALNAAAPSQ